MTQAFNEQPQTQVNEFGFPVDAAGNPIPESELAMKEPTQEATKEAAR